jgi:hypothetical protein
MKNVKEDFRGYFLILFFKIRSGCGSIDSKEYGDFPDPDPQPEYIESPQDAFHGVQASCVNS